MTKPEFLRGYLFLTAQPWGKTYRTMSMQLDGEPSPAEIQVEFYFQAFEKYDAEGWRITCEQFAAGDHWPSVDQLKASLKHYVPVRAALPAPEPEYISMEEALAGNPEAKAKLERLMHA